MEASFGEDLPALLPIAILVSLLAVFLVHLYSAFIDVSQAVYLSRSSLGLASVVLASVSSETGLVDESQVTPIGISLSGNQSIESPHLNVTGNVSVYLFDFERNITWHSGSFSEGRAKVSFPVLVGTREANHPAVFTLVVGDAIE
jgi:hypothetical protein